MDPVTAKTMFDTLDALSRLSAYSILIIAVVGLLRGWIVPKYIYDRETKAGDVYREMALRGVELSRRSIDAGHRLATLTGPPSE